MAQPEMPPRVHALDHIVLTVADIAATVRFYEMVLGMHAERFTVADGSTRWALFFGQTKINLHQAGAEFEPKAHAPTPGSADLCFRSDTTVGAWQAHLSALAVQIEEGPATRTGASGPLLSLYVRDPDGNLIEIGTSA